METNIKDVFENTKLTENGDFSFKSTLNKYVDLLFLAEYYSKHISEVKIGNSDIDKLFAMMIRDPRFGFGYRDYGRCLMQQAGVSPEMIVKAGRFDDLLYPTCSQAALDYIKNEIESGNQLAKKWMPRFSSSKKEYASLFAKKFGMSKQQYNKFIKVDTTESKLTEHKGSEIDFSKIPSKALLKYANRFDKGSDTSENYKNWKDSVASGKSNINISTATPYDLIKRLGDIDEEADLIFNRMEKISISCIPIVDTSASMFFSYANDAGYKAMAIGHYLAKCSTYLQNHVLSFSSAPTLIDVTDHKSNKYASEYGKEISTLFTNDCTNTNFGAVMKVLSTANDFPEYLIVLSDMEFDEGSSCKKDDAMEIIRKYRPDIKIIWWNFNSRNVTIPETDSYGNLFMSGYSATMLKFLQTGFDMNLFLNNLLKEYSKKIEFPVDFD